MVSVHVANDVHNLGYAGPFAALVDDSEVDVDALGDGAGAHHAAHIWGNDHQLLALVFFLDVLDENRRSEQVVGGNVEKALNLSGVEIEGQHPAGPGHGDEIGHQLGGNGAAGA